MRHCIPRSEWHFWYFGVQIAASQNRPEVLIAESVAVLELGVNRTAVTPTLHDPVQETRIRVGLVTAYSPPSELRSIPVLSAKRTTFPNGGSEHSALASSFGDLPCGPSSIGSHCSMCA